MGDAMLSTFHRLPAAKWMITTLGARGSVLLERADPLDPLDPSVAAAAAAARQEPSAALEDLLPGLFEQAAAAAAPSGAAAEPACRSSEGVDVWEGGVAALGAPRRLRLQRGGPLGGGGGEAERRRAAAAAAAAAANADAGNAAGYSGGAGGQPAEELVARVSVASAARLPEASGTSFPPP